MKGKFWSYLAVFCSAGFMAGCLQDGDRTLAPAGFENVTVGGELGDRLSRNFDRMETELYQPEQVYWTEQESGGWPGDKEGRGGIYNFVTKRGRCRENARLSWTQVETGSAITWKYPSCVLAGDNSVGEFYSVAMTNHFQQADTGTKMIHIGRNTRSRIVSKGISAGRSQNAYRGLVRIARGAENARNYSQCDSLLIGDKCGAHTFPEIDSYNPTGVVEHEATTSKISEEQLFYCNQRGLSTEDAVGLIVNGYAREVLAKLPMEFAVEAQKLLALSLEGSVG